GHQIARRSIWSIPKLFDGLTHPVTRPGRDDLGLVHYSGDGHMGYPGEPRNIANDRRWSVTRHVIFRPPLEPAALQVPGELVRRSSRSPHADLRTTSEQSVKTSVGGVPRPSTRAASRSTACLATCSVPGSIVVSGGVVNCAIATLSNPM